MRPALRGPADPPALCDRLHQSSCWTLRSHPRPLPARQVSGGGRGDGPLDEEI